MPRNVASRSEPEAERIRHLIALDAANVVANLTARLPEMVTLFSRLRDRAPLLGAFQSWFETVTFGELSRLAPHEQRAINVFYGLVGELRWYTKYTEDMPQQLERRLTLLVRELQANQRKLSLVLDGAEKPAAPKSQAKRRARRPKRRRRP
ncbi:MAG: hypothetical protein ACYCWW_06120 [Deltaproteobacteria bacterium]